jgi:hypothetical protein
MVHRMSPVFQINRRLEPGQYRLADVYADIPTYDVLRTVFADPGEFERVLEQTGVVVADMPHEMFVDNNDGTITIGLAHLRAASDEFLYLDIIHELCHVKQHLQGRNLYDRSKAYVDRETEIEAYEITVREARRIGLDDGAICCYLRVTWISSEEYRRLVEKMDAVGGLKEGCS